MNKVIKIQNNLYVNNVKNNIIFKKIDVNKVKYKTVQNISQLMYVFNVYKIII